MELQSKEYCCMVLGITAEASMADIKRAFRRKVRECHPDVLAEDDPGDERVKEVVKAYRALMSGEALSRSEWIAAAFKASGHVDSAPVMQTELPVFSLKPSIIFAITAGVAALAAVLFPLLNAILFADPIFDLDMPFSLTGEHVAYLSLFLSANLVGAGTAAAASTPVRKWPWLRWAMLGGLVFAALIVLAGLASRGAIYGAGVLPPYAPYALLTGALGGLCGGAICRRLHTENLYIHAAPASTPAASRAAAAGAACLNVLVVLSAAGLALGVVMLLVGVYMANPIQIPSESQ